MAGMWRQDRGDCHAFRRRRLGASSVVVRMAAVSGHSENRIMSAETDPDLSVRSAISRVLDAEQDALAQITACENRADQLLQETRQAVRAMVRRAQRRISRLHAGCEERTHELVMRAERDAVLSVAQPMVSDEVEMKRLKVVRSVAKELTTRESPHAG